MASWKPGGIVESMKTQEKEPFIEGAVDYSYGATQIVDNNASGIGKNFNEIILSMERGITAPISEMAAAAVADTPIPSYTEKVKDALHTGDIQKFRQLVARLIKVVPESIDEAVDAIADLIVAFYYSDIKSTEAQTAKAVIVGQIKLYLLIPFTFWVGLNWWYVWNYTHFTFNFMDFLKYPPFNIIYYVAEPGFYVLELMNYYVLTMRMDKDLDCWKRDILTALWDWKPVTFTLFMLTTAGLLSMMPVSDTAAGMVGGDSNPVSGLIFIGTIVAFFYLTVTCMGRMLKFNDLFQNFFLLAFMMLLFFLFVLIIAGMASGIATMYFFFFSHMVLICFELFNFPLKIGQMLNDLTTTPVSDKDAQFSEKPFTFLKQFIFLNFFGLFWVFCAVLPIFVYSMVQISTLSNFAMMITLIILVTFLDMLLLYPLANVLETFGKYLFNIIEQNSVPKVKVDIAPDPVVPNPRSYQSTRSAGSIFDDFLIFIMNPSKQL
jgi:hypothetical protein